MVPRPPTHTHRHTHTPPPPPPPPPPHTTSTHPHTYAHAHTRGELFPLEPPAAILCTRIALTAGAASWIRRTCRCGWALGLVAECPADETAVAGMQLFTTDESLQRTVFEGQQSRRDRMRREHTLATKTALLAQVRQNTCTTACSQAELPMLVSTVWLAFYHSKPNPHRLAVH